MKSAKSVQAGRRRRPHRRSSESAGRTDLDGFRQEVVHFARAHGWLVHFDQQPHGSAPHLTMARSLPSGDRRIVFARLVDTDDHLHSAEREWLHGIEQVALTCQGHVQAFAWWPEDANDVREVLK